ncbi:serine protease [Thalassotalea euphylliae]|uniref:Serine protease n=1 Tax=Thalassotalea euphylliae TaxID=1655234 RepID=A0A3E0TMH8_9GAMM|nr:S8 family serine peptidase [Thalassotalea euphylliae]REL25603.1 serine protease [Thalassotalea euphylliae]
MKFKSRLTVSLAALTLTVGVTSNYAYANTTSASDSVELSGLAAKSKSQSGVYIVQLKGASGITKASELGELLPSNQLVASFGNRYNPTTPNITRYVATMKAKQAQVASDIGNVDILYNYAHTVNGFAAKLAPEQVKGLRNHPDVLSVTEDRIDSIDTSNTPAFLGLVDENNQPTLDVKGENVVIGILDSGIWPENPAFAEDSNIPERAYDAPPEGWQGECNVGSVGTLLDGDNNVVYSDETLTKDETVTCNNKLIGARYYGTGFTASGGIPFDQGEFVSARDADGHGSHTASTAGGNAGVQASIKGVDIGVISGIAPRARIAAYKVCWPSSCTTADRVAAIDQAVVDGVDVLNHSIGNSATIGGLSTVNIASLKAAQAGVLFAGSAGNEGTDGPGSVRNIMPWMVTVGNSTYDGTSKLIGNELQYNIADAASTSVFSFVGTINPPIPDGGLSRDLQLVNAESTDNIYTACDPLTVDLTGKIALIARGTCNFTDKFRNAQAANADGIVVYTDDRSPIEMGGSGDTSDILIPGVMIKNADGLALLAALTAEVPTPVTVNMTNNAIDEDSVEVGNIMSSSSSIGPNPQTADIIKPDITAPGSRILAATSFDQLGTNSDGENFAYLSGTSMSSPHIAGMAALVMEKYPDWSPAQVKSALMTTAYQGVFKPNGSTPADPFNFGAGHASPVDATDPGLVYDTNFLDYLGFLCGQDASGLIPGLLEGGDCDTISSDGFATDASQLNLPSIAIAELSRPETITRTVTDATGNGGNYLVSVEAPAGIDVVITTFDSDNNPTDGNTLVVPANGKANYALTFSRSESSVVGEWVFGAVTLTGENGHVVRSPIAILPAEIVLIEAPAAVSVDLNSRGRGSFLVNMLYSGDTSIDYVGLTPSESFSNTADADEPFTFGSVFDKGYYLSVPEGTKALRVRLTEEMVSVPGSDIDLWLIICRNGACAVAATSQNFGNDEQIIVMNPEARNNPAELDTYILYMRPFDTAGEASVDYTVNSWVLNQAESSTRIRASTRAVDGRFNRVSITGRNLVEGNLHMGAVTFYNASGDAQATTLIEVQN